MRSIPAGYQSFESQLPDVEYKNWHYECQRQWQTLHMQIMIIRAVDRHKMGLGMHEDSILENDNCSSVVQFNDA